LEDAVSLVKKNEYDLMFLDNRLHPHESYKECVPTIWDNDYKGKIVVFSSDVDNQTACEISDFKVTDFIDKSSISIYNFEKIVQNYI
jgi:DNA-binding NarL/FixJ family response regulator